MTDRDKMLRALSAADFAAWEMHLYLDTHPDDREALEIYEEYKEKAAQCRAVFEERFGALSGAGGCEWVRDPWPWQFV